MAKDVAVNGFEIGVTPFSLIFTLYLVRVWVRHLVVPTRLVVFISLPEEYFSFLFANDELFSDVPISPFDTFGKKTPHN